MQLKHNDTLRLVAVLAIGVLLSGCSQTKTAEAPAKKPEAAQKDEYVRTTSTGSWIPKKVKKNTVPKNDSATQTIHPDALDKVNESGRTQGTRGLGP